MSRTRRIRTWLLEHREPIVTILYRVAVAAVVLVFVAACLHGIANVWAWGHNGYNGAAFSQAARNSLRFSMFGQAQYHTGLEPPILEQMYTHHPMMLHFHLMAVFHQFGYSELAARLVPAIYSVLGLLMLFVIVRRYYGRALALASITVYTLIPLNLIFANMVDHEQGSIFWCLFFLYHYCRWFETKRWVYLALVVVGVTMAVQFDWPGYYLAFFIVWHAIIVGIQNYRAGRKWRSDLGFVVVFSVVVLANFFIFFGFIIALRGGVGEMIETYQLRASHSPGYLILLWNRSLDLYGPLLMTLLAIWVPYFVVRLARRQAHLGDMLPGFFVLVQLIHSTVFEQAGFIHAYWTYHINPGLAVAVSMVVLAAARDLPTRLVAFLSRPSPSAAPPERDQTKMPHGWVAVTLAAIIIATPLVFQARFAYSQMRWGFDTGSAAYESFYNDQYLEIRFVQELTRHYDRADTNFVLHTRLPWRAELIPYLDTPFEYSDRTELYDWEFESDRRIVFLFDTHQLPDLRRINWMVSRYHTKMYDRQYIAIDLTNPDGRFESYVRVEEEPSLLWSWLVNPNHPPFRWVPDPDIDEVRALFADDVHISAQYSFGGSGGGAVNWDCPRGQVLSGFDMVVFKSWEVFINLMQPLCHPLVLPNQVDRSAANRLPFEGPVFGYKLGFEPLRIECPPDRVVVGLRGNSSERSYSFELLCSALLPPQPNGQGNALFVTDEPTASDTMGRGYGEPFEFMCPEGSLAWGYRGRVGVMIDAFGISCAEINAAFLNDDATVDSMDAPRIEN